MAQRTAQGRDHGRDPGRRRRELAEHVLNAGPVPAAELAVRFGVSLMTVYRDIEELEGEGVLRKTRGGVTAQPSGVFESNVAYRRKSMRAEKAALAAHALALVEPGMSVMLDDSTTVLELARLLPAVEPLTIATNFLEALNLLSGRRGLRLLGLGGEYDPLHDSFLGPGCEDAVRALRVDVCFVSTSSVTGGFAYHQEQRIVAVKRAMIESAGRSVLLVDHTKLSRRALHRLAPLDAFDLVVVDGRAPAEALRALAALGIPYEVAPVLPTTPPGQAAPEGPPGAAMPQVPVRGRTPGTAARGAIPEVPATVAVSESPSDEALLAEAPPSAGAPSDEVRARPAAGRPVPAPRTPPAT
ncbi:DeoR/GlpR family DNA-binding transcription regulator [Streptomyces fuscigenes]|uniref:DeoR/GlpR family DNA-binding transcription regulator n=1 Tax=Streptomyces fuscigenes TaxID=1528880 RepID=UPI0027DFAAD2|nr:DeoR family transcriptional regulator [Streptomyces fuscigenes]